MWQFLSSLNRPYHLVMRSHLLILALLSHACISIPTSRDANISYSTEPSSWPASPTCLNKPSPQGIAKEVLIGSIRTVVIAGGPDPISDVEWEGYNPGLGNQKNSDRHLLFSRSCFSRSPARPATCAGDDCAEILTKDGHTWVHLSKIEAADCTPDPSACDGTAAKPGGLVAVVTRKCHELVFEGSAYLLSGPRGERAVMHATADGVPTTDVSLPAGWTLRREPLREPLVLHPFGGGDVCFYNVIRDHKLQSYHQIAYPGPMYP